MSEKQKEILERFGGVVKKLNDKEQENLLLIGEGMAIMAGIKESSKAPQNKELAQVEEED